MLKDRPDILGELRILLNFCVSDSFLLTFVFSGQKPLDSVLRAMPEFWQRLPVRFFLRNLDYNDTKGLIRYRLEKVGGSPEIFTEDAFEGIYNYAEGCPRIICAVADLCLVIGYAKGARRIGFVEVSTACRDMEASGDGFHYFAFVKAHDLPVDERKLSPKRKQRGKPDTASDAPDSAGDIRSLPRINSIVCPVCSEPNNRERRFCAKCDSPLYRKCPGCGTLFDTVSNECPACGIDVDEVRKAAVETAVRDFEPYDIMESGADVWLRAAGVSLDPGERVVIIFPRGTMLSSGPSVEAGKPQTGKGKKPCDIVLTERRLMIVGDGGAVETDLQRVETCLVSDTGRLFGERHMIILGFGGDIYRLYLPFGSRRTKTALDLMASFIQQEMLK
jgi:hypothetical protein